MLKFRGQDLTLSIAGVSGVSLRLHLSSLWLPALAVVTGYVSANGGLHGAMFMGLFVLLLHGCALLHELGHIVPATRYGAKVTQVRISGLGAFVRVETSMPTTPRHEMIIALGGPLVSAIITAMFAGLFWLAIGPVTPADWIAALGRQDATAMLAILAVTNLLLVVFNLLPALPMDGGKAFAAFLALFFSRPAATRMVTSFGQVMAIATAAATGYLTHSTLLRIVGFAVGACLGLYVLIVQPREMERAEVGSLQ